MRTGLRTPHRITLTLCVSIVCGSGSFTHAADALDLLQQSLVETIEKTEQSVVSIAKVRRSRRQGRVDFPFDRQMQDRDDPENPDFIPNEFGTGLIIAPSQGGSERFILTNYHVVREGPIYRSLKQSRFDLFVRLPNGQSFYTSIIAADPRSDLAVLRVDVPSLKLKPADLKPFILGKGEDLKKGQFVLSLGNPYAIGRDGSASAGLGMISNISRRPMPLELSAFDPSTRKEETIHHFGTLVQIDSRINLGSSGGALVNLKGELVGITTSLAALEGYEKSVGYAIPIDAGIRRAIEALIQGREVEYGFLGVNPQDFFPTDFERLSKSYSQRFAAQATKVFSNSPAALGQMRPGDVILSINGKTVNSKYDLMREVGQLGPDETELGQTWIKVWRERTDQELNLRIKLGKWPVVDDEGIIATAPRHPLWAGLRIDFPTGRQRFLLRPVHFHRAVLITEVEPNSPADRANLKPGDYVTEVNGKTVETPRDFHTAVRNGGEVTLRILNRAENNGLVKLTP